MPLSVRIHIGPWKTGSTSIQSFCNSKREVLRGIGIHYPEGQITIDAHHEIPNLMRGLDERLKVMNNTFNSSLEDTFNRYFQAIKEGELEQLWLSSEDFAMLELEEFIWLADYFSSRDIYDLKFIAYDFNPSERLNSYINQIIVQGEYVDEISRKEILSSISELSQKLKYLRAELKSNGIELILLNYKEARANDNLIAIFLESVGLSASQSDSLIKFGPPLEAANESLHLDEGILFNKFNEANVTDRTFDGNCPILFSDNYPLERKRLLAFQEATSRLTEFRKTITELQNKNTSLHFERDELEKELVQIKNSSIWRSTEPYRLLRRKISKFLK